MNILRYGNYPVEPWKNGQGVTREIVKHEPDGGDGFVWRLSLAEVGRPGPFSTFGGYDRTITLLGGDGFSLNFGDGTVVVLDTPHEPCDFDGGAPLQCELIDRMSQDLNLMVKRGHMSAEWLVLSLDPTETIRLETVSGVTQILFCLEGGAQLKSLRDGDGDGEDSRPHTLNAWDCAVLTEGDAVEITTAPNSAPKLFHAVLRTLSVHKSSPITL